MIKNKMLRPHRRVDDIRERHHKAPMPPRDDLEGLIMHTGHLLHRQNHHHFGRSQDELLDILSKRERVSQKELSEHLRIKPGSLSETINKLEEKELIERNIDDEDHRISNISLTTKGKRFIGRNEINKEDRFNVLSKTEKETLKELLIKLINSLEKE